MPILFNNLKFPQVRNQWKDKIDLKNWYAIFKTVFLLAFLAWTLLLFVMVGSFITLHSPPQKLFIATYLSGWCLHLAIFLFVHKADAERVPFSYINCQKDWEILEILVYTLSYSQTTGSDTRLHWNWKVFSLSLCSHRKYYLYFKCLATPWLHRMTFLFTCVIGK